MAPTSASTTAVTEQDKLREARAKDAQKNLKATQDVDAAEQTAAHVTRLPSDVDALATKYGLTTTEAERVLDETSNEQSGKKVENAVDAVKAERTVNRQVYVREPAGLAHPFADRPSIPAPPTPPTPEELDPYAPKGDEPTARVIDSAAAGFEPDTTEAEERADQYAAAVDESVAATDEALEDASQ